jgi:hypothetical protein
LFHIGPYNYQTIHRLSIAEPKFKTGSTELSKPRLGIAAILLFSFCVNRNTAPKPNVFNPVPSMKASKVIVVFFGCRIPVNEGFHIFIIDHEVHIAIVIQIAVGRTLLKPGVPSPKACVTFLKVRSWLFRNP